MLKLALTASALASVCSAGQVMTSISFQGRGFPDGVFKAHLHAASCANDGGGHYQHNGPAVDADNENWPEVTCMNGRCTGAASNMWAPTANAVAAGLSIVVHDTPGASSGSGAKMLCADLVGSAGEYSGELAYLPSYIGAATNAYGAMDAVYGSVRKDEVSMTFAGTQTAISFQGRGFPDGVFKSHLHAAACANDGGGHFNGGDGVTVDAINENWPEVTCYNSKCTGMAASDWVPSVAQLAAGLSLLVHDTPAAASGSGSKMLCADLTRSGHGTFNGEFSYLATYTGTGYGELGQSSAALMKPELATSAGFKGTGFGNNAFNAHLHADTCANGGGGHYQHNGATVDAVNENWPIVSCSEGTCTGMAWNDWWIPAADRASLSIVIHDTPNNGGSGSGPKMMCADLAGQNGKFSYLEAFAGAGYGSFGKSSATLAYGMGKGKGGGGKGGGNGGKRGSSKRGGKYASLENSNAAMVNNASIVGAAVGAGLLVVAAALFAIKKRSARVSIAESETLLE